MSVPITASNLPLFPEVKGDIDLPSSYSKSILTKDKELELIENDSTLSDIQKEIASNKLQGTLKTTRAYNAVELGVDRLSQANYYYCGPATVYQNLSFLGGSPYSQYYYAGKPTYFGTNTMDKLDTDAYKATPHDYLHKVMNYYQNKYYYAKAFISGQSDMKTKIDYCLSRRAPVALLIKTTSSVFGYNSDGHFLTLSGQNSGATQYSVVDPNSASVRSLTAQQAYTAVSAKANTIYW